MNELAPFRPGQMSKVFGDTPVTNDLGGGIAVSYGIVGIKGKVFTIKYRGDEKQLLREDGDGPRNSLEVVIVGANKNVTKTFYAGGYVEGSNAAPDCYSNNGVTPEPTVTARQSPTCAACPRNVWGAKVSELTGKPGKQCQDNKRIAIVPLQDIPNQGYGGPLLMRVPAASLQELGQYSDKMQQLGYLFYAIGTRISFDTTVAYPKLLFTGIRPLNDQEGADVLELREKPILERILSETEFDTTPQAEPDKQTELNKAFEQPPQAAPQAAPQPAPQPTQTAAPPHETNKGGNGAWGTSQPAQTPPSTGEASTKSAQPAASAPQATTPAPTPQPQAPATGFPQPTPTPQEVPAAATPSPAGGVGTANTEQSQGFGFTGAAPVNSEGQSPSPDAVSDFEKSLDAAMAKLLPAAAPPK